MTRYLRLIVNKPYEANSFSFVGLKLFQAHLYTVSYTHMYRQNEK